MYSIAYKLCLNLLCDTLLLLLLLLLSRSWVEQAQAWPRSQPASSGPASACLSCTMRQYAGAAPR
jgi:hypothetical protein